jgi:hypothetical protein
MDGKEGVIEFLWFLVSVVSGVLSFLAILATVFYNWDNLGGNLHFLAGILMIGTPFVVSGVFFYVKSRRIGDSLLASVLSFVFSLIAGLVALFMLETLGF